MGSKANGGFGSQLGRGAARLVRGDGRRRGDRRGARQQLRPACCRDRPRPSCRAPGQARHSAERALLPASPFDRSSIGEATTLAALEAMVAAFDGCGLKRTAKSLCFARGSAKARLMLIGEAPGRDEDLQGKPFVGRAGQLLDRMLARSGSTRRTSTSPTPSIGARPATARRRLRRSRPARRSSPSRSSCLSPKLLVLLGGAAAKSLLGVSEGIMRLRGKWLNYSKRGRRRPHARHASPCLSPAQTRGKALRLARPAIGKKGAGAAMTRFDESRPFIPVRIAVLTISDTRTPKTDKSGPLLAASSRKPATSSPSTPSPRTTSKRSGSR